MPSEGSKSKTSLQSGPAAGGSFWTSFSGLGVVLFGCEEVFGCGASFFDEPVLGPDAICGPLTALGTASDVARLAAMGLDPSPVGDLECGDIATFLFAKDFGFAIDRKSPSEDSSESPSSCHDSVAGRSGLPVCVFARPVSNGAGLRGGGVGGR